MIDQSNLPGFEQRLEIRDDHRPALRDGSDELGVRLFARMRECELRRRPRGFNLERAFGVALCLERRAPFTAPTQHQALRRNALENLARVDRKSTRLNSSHGYISYA